MVSTNSKPSTYMLKGQPSYRKGVDGLKTGPPIWLVLPSWPTQMKVA